MRSADMQGRSIVLKRNARQCRYAREKHRIETQGNVNKRKDYIKIMKGATTMIKINAKITFTEEVLGTANSDKDIHSEFIASKAPDAPSREQEIEAIGADEVERKEMTIFPRNKDNEPIFWDYQFKGFFKDSVGALRKVTGTKSSKIKAFKKEIDGLVFINPREIVIHVPEGGEMGTCQRPLRASTAQGERVALANSETVPAGSWCEFEIITLKDDLSGMIKECLSYGQLKGMGQWRNSGKGKFTCEILNEEKTELSF